MGVCGREGNCLLASWALQHYRNLFPFLYVLVQEYCVAPGLLPWRFPQVLEHFSVPKSCGGVFPPRGFEFRFVQNSPYPGGRQAFTLARPQGYVPFPHRAGREARSDDLLFRATSTPTTRWSKPCVRVSEGESCKAPGASVTDPPRVAAPESGDLGFLSDPFRR